MFIFRLCFKWFVCFIERVCIFVFFVVILLYLRIVIINWGLVSFFIEFDNLILFYFDVWICFRIYLYLCFLNVCFFLCLNILCYDWFMDSIFWIELWWDMCNVEIFIFILIMVWLCFYGKFWVRWMNDIIFLWLWYRYIFDFLIIYLFGCFIVEL